MKINDPKIDTMISVLQELKGSDAMVYSDSISIVVPEGSIGLIKDLPIEGKGIFFRKIEGFYYLTICIGG